MKDLLRLPASVMVLGVTLGFTILAGPLRAGARPASTLAGDQPFRQPEPSPTVDRLAIPILPEPPNEIDLGRNLYYYHCMPCHGDYTYLSSSHPPQRPGALEEDEYRALTAFLFSLTGRALPAPQPGTEILARRLLNVLRLAILILGGLLLALVITRWLQTRRALRLEVDLPEDSLDA